jgi:hypothetical protein
MPLKVIENKKPKLKDVHMVCDTIIDPKLEEFPAIKTCFGTSSTTLVCGGTGSGKTTWVLQLLKTIFRKCFHQIIICMPENSMNSISDKDNILRKYIPPEDIYHEFSEETLTEIYEKIDENSKEGYFTLFICDDWGNRLKSKVESKILQSMCIKQRHLRLSAFILIQSWFQCPKNIREVVSNAVIFNSNKSNTRKFFDEVLDMKKDDITQVLKRLPTAHDHILCSLKTHKIFHQWNEIQVVDDEEESDKE